ncbi:iron-containing alcohol dehydrogenase [Candidatus Sororendozoicomonas aggregata]|uniref:iron-containing alcohol dehydrogenase n=1 Tax=Candidatus Sororendozoicomonas aggregata TaxID=3073239 RepID=UPI002ED4C049
MMTTHANWSYPTHIRFGAGRLREVGEACADIGIENPLVVTDKGLAKRPITQTLKNTLNDNCLNFGFFSGVEPNPTDENLEAGLKAYIEGKHDGVIGFGGGSALDLGKLIAFQAGQTRPIWDFEDIGDRWTQADTEVIAPNIAIPTTAGTGSEVGRAGVLTDSKNHVKKIIFHPKMLPSRVIADPALTVDLPPVVTVGTGLDAFIHSLEAYCSPSYHPMSQGIALEGMRLIKENLPIVYETPSNMEARGHMMTAAAMGATAFQKGLGAMHALSHPVSAVFNTPHGMTNAVVMPAVLRFNRPAIEESITSAASYMGIDGGFDGFYDHMIALSETLNVPKSLEELGANPGKIELLAKMAIKDPSAGGNPVELTLEAAINLYSECF